MEHFLDKIPDCTVKAEEGVIGDLVIAISKVDMSEVTTPDDLSIPTEAFIGTLLEIKGNERTLGGIIRLDITEDYKKYKIKTAPYKVIVTNPTWKIKEKGIEYLSEHYVPVVAKNHEMHGKGMFIQ